MVNGGPTERRRLGHCSLFIYIPASYKDLLQVLCTCVLNRIDNTYSNMAHNSIKIKIEKNALINIVDLNSRENRICETKTFYV